MQQQSFLSLCDPEDKDERFNTKLNSLLLQGSKLGRGRLHPSEAGVNGGLRVRFQAARWRWLSWAD